MSIALKLQKYQAKDYNGLVTDTHFNTLYQQEPQLIDDTIHMISRVALQSEYASFVNKFPTMEVEQENNFYEWMLQGDHEKNLPLLKAYDAGGSSFTDLSKAGIGVSTFYLVFAEAYFEPDNIIVGEVEDYHVRIKSMKPLSGAGYEYECELLTNDVNLFIPSEELTEGTRWSKDYNLAPSTLGSRGAKPNFTSPFRMRNRVSQLRMQYEVPGNMIQKGQNEPLKFNFKTPQGNVKPWINYQDMIAVEQHLNAFARMKLYGKPNWTVDNVFLNKDANSKYNLESGAGMFEQIDPSNVHFYTEFDIDTYVETLVDMGVGRIERGKRYITIGTGEFGMIQAHRQLERKASNWTPNFDTSFMFNTSSDQGLNRTRGIGQQFTEYSSVNGIHLKFEILPFFDDKIRFKKNHPTKRGTTESYRYIAFDYGGEAGIYNVKVKGLQDTWAYINGMRDPFTAGGKGSPKQVVSPVDGYEIHRQSWGGMLVKDPTKIVDWRLNVVR